MGIKIFISYAVEDMDSYQVSQIAASLKLLGEIEAVVYWEEDAQGSISEFMDENIENCNVFLLFCSPNLHYSEPARLEWGAALNLGKPIIPIFRDVKDIPPILRQLRGIPFNSNELPVLIQKLYVAVLKGFQTGRTIPLARKPDSNGLDPSEILSNLVYPNRIGGIVITGTVTSGSFSEYKADFGVVLAQLDLLLALINRPDDLPTVEKFQTQIYQELEETNTKLKPISSFSSNYNMSQFEVLHRMKLEIQEKLRALQQKIAKLKKGLLSNENNSP